MYRTLSNRAWRGFGENSMAKIPKKGKRVVHKGTTHVDRYASLAPTARSTSVTPKPEEPWQRQFQPFGEEYHLGHGVRRDVTEAKSCANLLKGTVPPPPKYAEGRFFVAY